MSPNAGGEKAGIDAAGREVPSELNDRGLSISSVQIRRIPDVIGIGGGLEKAETIAAILRGRWINTLITDAGVARRLLAYPRPFSSRRHVSSSIALTVSIGVPGRLVSGSERIFQGSQGFRISQLLVLGRGPSAEIWVVGCVSQNQQASRPQYDDGGLSPAKSFALAAGMIRQSLRATLERTKRRLRARSRLS